MSRRRLRGESSCPSGSGGELSIPTHLPMHGTIDAGSVKRLKREHEDGVYAQARGSCGDASILVSELREMWERLLLPTRGSAHVEGRESAALAADAEVPDVPPLFLGACYGSEAAAQLLKSELVTAIESEDWPELWVLLRQIFVCIEQLAVSHAVRPWWVRQALGAADSGVSEQVDLVARDAPGGADAPIDAIRAAEHPVKQESGGTESDEAHGNDGLPDYLADSETEDVDDDEDYAPSEADEAERIIDHAAFGSFHFRDEEMMDDDELAEYNLHVEEHDKLTLSARPGDGQSTDHTDFSHWSRSIMQAELKVLTADCPDPMADVISGLGSLLAFWYPRQGVVYDGLCQLVGLHGFVGGNADDGSYLLERGEVTLTPEGGGLLKAEHPWILDGILQLLPDGVIVPTESGEIAELGPGDYERAQHAQWAIETPPQVFLGEVNVQQRPKFSPYEGFHSVYLAKGSAENNWSRVLAEDLDTKDGDFILYIHQEGEYGGSWQYLMRPRHL